MQQREKNKIRRLSRIPDDALFLWRDESEKGHPKQTYAAPYRVYSGEYGDTCVYDQTNSLVVIIRNCTKNKYRAKIIELLCVARYGGEE